jgi:hypothetical protein
MIVRALCLALVAMTTFIAQAQAQSVTHPIWAATKDAAKDAPARLRFETAIKTRGLGPMGALERPATVPDSNYPGAGANSPEDLALDKEAATLARAKGASFALLGRLHSADNDQIDLRLVDAYTGLLRDCTAVALAGDGTLSELETAVLRLDEIAGRTDLARRAETGQGKAEGTFPVAAPPPRTHSNDGPSLSQDAHGWMRQHWPLLTALTVAVGTAVVLGIVVAKDTTQAHYSMP